MIPFDVGIRRCDTYGSRDKRINISSLNTWLVEIHGAQLGTNTRLVDRYAIPSRYFHNIGRQERRIEQEKASRGVRNVCGESRTRLEFNIWRRRNTKILHTKYRERIGLSRLRYAHCISRSASHRVSLFLSPSSREARPRLLLSEADLLRYVRDVTERVSRRREGTTLPTTDGTSEIADNE